MTDAGAPAMPPNDPDSAHDGGFDLGSSQPAKAGTPYRVLARKYRPASFDDLIGQEAVVRTVSNAFLKTLEEPPEHAKFVFATTEIRKVPVTVLSRCQRFDMRRVDADVLMAHLANIAAKENVDAEPEALGIIARAAEGSVRDSLSLLDQAIAHAAGLVRADAVRQMLGLADRNRG